ncbi:orotidine-5'-phosphate decarboxylase [Methylocapsa acidiphila]|uniref:orotidine-5'-phosphate decarboxylase n=1 Tax=Methylocapsa acidiphila TaxID=133552 RepID=UPI00040FB882|nr:orotidine-5'-phosphate decarboxylase [Methylocapsa acidiphila]
MSEARALTGLESLPARQRLIAALDFSTVREAETMVERLGDSVAFYKIGMELAYGGGLPFAKDLVAAGKRVFLDLKLHDIPTTVTKACANVARLGADFLTVHAYPQTMGAAMAGVAGTPLRLLAVTVMTSYDDQDLREAGYAFAVKDLVARRAEQARRAGIHGLILSAGEAKAMRAKFGPELILATPGIRPVGSETRDQKRAMTPAAARAAGADYLVVGRPITEANDPKAAAEAIVADIAGVDSE